MRANQLSPLLTHVAAWIFFLSMPVLFVNGMSESSNILAIVSSPYTWAFFITYLVIFYGHTWLVLPLLYGQKRYLLYAGMVVALFAAVWLVRPFDRLVRDRQGGGPVWMQRQGPSPGKAERFHPPHEAGKDGGRPAPRIDVVSIFLFIMVLAMSFALYSRQRQREAEERALRAEADKANAELSFLKAQINPHFLFNTLNNIYSLAAARSEHTADSLLKLSNIMRYVTDEVSEAFVPLEQEVAFISDYIDLQRLRLGTKTSVDFQVSGQLTDNRIAPLILITFIENVFKYGISKHEPAGIVIRVSATENDISFFSQNKLYDVTRNVERTGIGIDNTKKRLEHLYPGRHALLIATDNGRFTVDLRLRADTEKPLSI